MWLFRQKKKIQTKNGRKYRMAVLFGLFIVCCFGLTTMNPILVKVFPEVVGGLVGIFLVYCGGNIGSKAVLGKWQGATVQTEIQLQNQQNDERGL